MPARIVPPLDRWPRRAYAALRAACLSFRLGGHSLKPPPFEYHAPESLDEALALLAAHGDDCRPLAGGQSLIPLLSFRLARPAHLVDLNRATGFPDIEGGAAGLSIGAMVRQRRAERSPVVREHCPLLSDALALIGHPAIRNRGTVGGSIAHADPAAELPAVAVALDAGLVVRGPEGERTVRAADFFVGHYSTDLQSDECLVRIDLPPWPPGAGWSIQETARRHGDFAIAAVAAVVQLDGGGTVADARLALAGVDDRPVRASAAEAQLVGSVAGPAAFAAAAQQAAVGIDPPSDLHGSAAYRRHVVQVLVRRALEAASQRAEVRL